MKANELMIGDWVYGLVVDEGDDLNKIIDRVPSKVTMINEYGDIHTQGPFPIDDEEYNGEWEWYDIEPIPLTPEILEKNGFEYVGSEVYECDILPFYIWWERDRHRLGIDIEDNTYDKENFAQMLRVPVSYVHEFQHCLKLFGIDKEITIQV